MPAGSAPLAATSAGVGPRHRRSCALEDLLVSRIAINRLHYDFRSVDMDRLKGE